MATKKEKKNKGGQGGLVVLGLLIVLIGFGVQAWRGEIVPVPGINAIASAIKGALGVPTVEQVEQTDPEATPTSQEEAGTEEEAEEKEPDLSMSREIAERDKRNVLAFENSEGYLRVQDEGQYEELVKALSRLRVEGGAKASLKDARGAKKFPLFFSVALDEKIETSPLHRVVGTALIEGCKNREEAYPLSDESEYYAIGVNPTANPEKSLLGVPNHRTMREFTEIRLAPLFGGKTEGVRSAAIKGLKHDMRHLGVKTVLPSLFIAKISPTYRREKGREEEHTHTVKFIPYIEGRALATHSMYTEMRENFAIAVDLDPQRLEKEIEKVVEDTNADRVFVVYKPHADQLSVSEVTAKTDVRIRHLKEDDLRFEAYRMGATLLGPSASIEDLQNRILDDFGLYEVVNGMKIYHYDQFPREFCRIDAESKSGVGPKQVVYRPVVVQSVDLANRAGVQRMVQKFLDEDPNTTHFEYGCVQSWEDILALLDKYQATFEDPSDAFPCYMEYNYPLRQVTGFHKAEAAEDTTSGSERSSSKGEGYNLWDLSEESLNKVKKLIVEDYPKNGEDIVLTMSSLKDYQKKARQLIAEGGPRMNGISLASNGEIIGGRIVFVVEDDMVKGNIVRNN